ncbi:MAG: hypothetical protein GKR96_06405 [Gammaproteobacteria bacterium]|nr:hypothetical protein [Gammaproteobacteria bacterium]
MELKLMKAVFIGFISAFVVGCGGGGSSSGGSASSSDATSCVIFNEFTPASTSFTNVFTGEVTSLPGLTQYRYTNTCGFAVNVATHLGPTISSSFLDEFSLAVGQHRDLNFSINHSACQDPSKPVLLGRPFGEVNVGCS